MKGGIERGQTVARKTEAAGEADIAVTAPTCVPNIGFIDRAVGLVFGENRVLAMTICTNWCSLNTIGDRLAVDTHFELLRDIAVAHPAGIGNSLAELLRRCFLHFMSGTVADGTIGSTFAFADRFSMHAAGVAGMLIGMAGTAFRLSHVLRVRICLHLIVAGFTSETGMRGRIYFLLRIVAPAAIKRLLLGVDSCWNCPQ